MDFKKHKRFAIRSTTALSAILIGASVLTGSPLTMHADDTSTQSQNTDAANSGVTDTNKGGSSASAPSETSSLDTNKWTAVDKPKTITRTIHYIDEKGKAVAPDVIERHTGEVFSSKEGDKTITKAFVLINGAATNVIPKFAAVSSPVIKGYKIKDQNFANIPEQNWSLDGTQAKDPKTGFYINIAQDEVINVTYTKTSNAKDVLKEAVPISGYTVLNVKNMTRTINYVDDQGKRLHDSEIESVKYETVSPDKLTPKEQAERANQKTAVIRITTDKDGNIIRQDTELLATPSYKLKDVESPKIEGYTLQNKKFATLSGQYMWLADTPYVHATLDNGLPQYMIQDEMVDVIYIPATTTDNGKAKRNPNNQKKLTAGTAVNSNKNPNSSDTGATNGTTTDNDNSASSVELPQTGNTRASSVFLGTGIAALLSSLALGYKDFKKWFTK